MFTLVGMTMHNIYIMSMLEIKGCKVILREIGCFSVYKHYFCKMMLILNRMHCIIKY